MARAKSWSVKGIDQETRGIAREAAARGEQPIGAWIDRAIRARTGLPAETDPPPSAQDALPGMVDGGATETVETPGAGSVPDAAVAAQATGGLRRHGGAWYGIGGIVVLSLMGGGFWVMERLDGTRQAPRIAATGPSAPLAPTAAAPEKPSAAARAPGGSQMARLIAKAERNNPAAQYDLGMIYARGETTPRNDKEAARWFASAARQGLPAAQFNLGVFSEQGRGTARDLSLAFFWYQSAAEQGHARARHNLGTMLAEGKGTARDYDRAAHWFAQAAEAGMVESYVSLGMLYEHGLGRARDINKALDLYRQAVAKGSKPAEKLIAALAPAAAARPSTGTAVGLDIKGIGELQRLLSQLELSPGTADGVLGRKTVAAIRMYQEFAGLPIDGKPTEGLLADLRQVVGAMGGKTDAAGR